MLREHIKIFSFSFGWGRGCILYAQQLHETIDALDLNHEGELTHDWLLSPPTALTWRLFIINQLDPIKMQHMILKFKHFICTFYKIIHLGRFFQILCDSKKEIHQIIPLLMKFHDLLTRDAPPAFSHFLASNLSDGLA